MALTVHYNTASKLIDNFERLGLLSEITGRRRDRIFSFEPYLDLFREEPIQDRVVPIAATEAGEIRPSKVG